MVHNDINVLFLDLLNNLEISYNNRNLFVISIITMFRYQMYTDYYMKLNLAEKTDVITNEENN